MLNESSHNKVEPGLNIPNISVESKSEIDLDVLKQEIAQTDNMRDFIAKLRERDDIETKTGKIINGKAYAKKIEELVDLIKKGLDENKAKSFLTRDLDIRYIFERHMQNELRDEEGLVKDIQEASSFTELYKTLESAGNIYSSNKDISPDLWISAIESVREIFKDIGIDISVAPRLLNSITRKYGLRAKVMELLEKEHNKNIN